MPTVNNGVLDGIRRIGGRFRDITIDGGLPGAPLGFRLRGATQSGAPTAGTWKTGEIVPARNATLWMCIAGGTPGTWAQCGTGPAGPAGLNWRGAYSNTTTYAANDAVQYNGSAFIATAGTTGVNPGTPASPGTNWSLLAEIGNTGPAGSGTAGVVAPSSQGFLAWSIDPTTAQQATNPPTGQP